MLEFLQFKGVVASNIEQDYILKILKELKDPNSYYTSLQMCYNNNLHFSSSSYIGLNNYYLIQELVNKIFNESDLVYIKGGIHNNNHISGLLYDSITGNPIFVTDTYIQIHDKFKIYHILIQPPLLNNFNWVYNGNYPFIPPCLISYENFKI